MSPSTGLDARDSTRSTIESALRYAVTVNAPGSLNDTLASFFPPCERHLRSALFLIAALITPCGVVHRSCVRPATAASAGAGAGPVWFHAYAPLSAWVTFC